MVKKNNDYMKNYLKNYHGEDKESHFLKAWQASELIWLAVKYGTDEFDWLDILALIWRETHFDTMAYNRTFEATCAMQVVHSWWKNDEEYNKIIKNRLDLYDLEKCIWAGTYAFKKSLERAKGDKIKAFIYYSGGASRFDKKLNRIVEYGEDVKFYKNKLRGI